MSIYVAEQLSEVDQIPSNQHSGDGLLPPAQVAEKWLEGISYSEASRKMVDTLLTGSDIAVEWVPDNDGWCQKTVSDQVKEAVTLNLEVAQVGPREVYEYANNHLAEFKTEVIEGIYTYGRSLGIEDTNLKEVLVNRIENIDEVKISAPVAQGDIYGYITRNSSAVAGIESKSGELKVGVASLLAEAKVNGVTMAQQLRSAMLHELVHGVSVHALTPDGSWMIKSGIGVLPTDESGKRLSWTGDSVLDEGSQEQIRWRQLDEGTPSYETGVMFWEMIQALDPMIEKLRFEAKFLNRNRGEMIGRIEAILGPSAVEEIEFFERTNSSLVHFADYKDKLVSMIDIYDEDTKTRTRKTEAARQEARKTLDDVQREIYAPRGFDFTDEQLKKAKSKGATKTSAIASALINT